MTNTSLPKAGWAAALLLTVWASAAGARTDTPQTLSLAGQWRFSLDPQNVGVAGRWFERGFAETIRLPGSLPAQGVGDPVTLETPWVGGIQDSNWHQKPLYAPFTRPANFKFPFWLQPETYYAGAAWYQRDIEIPTGWAGRRVILSLERPHWLTEVWLDELYIGSNDSLATAHEYNLGSAVRPGKHRLTIRVDNRMIVDVGENSHCVSDHTQGNWNGIVGDIHLRTTPTLWLEDLQVYPELAARQITVRGVIGNTTGVPGTGVVSLVVGPKVESGKFRGRSANHQVTWKVDGGSFELRLPVPDARPWDEFNRNLYLASATLEPQGSARSTYFGFREIATQGTQFLINGRPAFFRGTLECCIFPLTGHPPTDVASWRKFVQTAQAHGLNMFRFHSYCPPRAAFAAADELGFYLQVETCWPNQSVTLGDGKPVDQWVYNETERILKAYGNHPSFVLMPHGNEPGGDKAGAFLAEWVNHFKAKDPRRLWSSGSGWPQIPENQFHLSPDPRVQGWGQGLKSRINGQPPETTTDYRDYIKAREVPVISHEIGQWCVYPNFAEMGKYDGYLKPRNFEIFRSSLRAKGMGDLAREFLMASGKLQALCYKEDIEAALRTPGMGGFQLLDLRDFPGQGTALVGVLDPFWEEKGYVTAAEYRRFCNVTVPLARLSKRVFPRTEMLKADVEVAHFGAAPMRHAVVAWRLEAGPRSIVASGRLPARTIEVGNGATLGTVQVDLLRAPAPARLRLVVGVEGTRFENDWDVWVYPETVAEEVPANVLAVKRLNEPALERLNQGGRVLLLLEPGRVKGDELGPVGLGFSSIFWNTAWTQRQPPHTLGILCNPRHPALAEFPTEFHSNWQWWYLVSRAGAMILDDLPHQLRPVVQVVDDWVTNRKLGLLFEARVGRGRLMVCSIDLEGGLEDNPVARQFRQSLLRYMSGKRFNPRVEVDAEDVRRLMTE